MYCPDFILPGDILWRQAGPLVIHPLIYHFPKIVYRQEFAHSQVQKLAYGLVLAHFLKRELETVLWVLLRHPVALNPNCTHGISVHRFSHATMPFRNIFKK